MDENLVKLCYKIAVDDQSSSDNMSVRKTLKDLDNPITKLKYTII